MTYQDISDAIVATAQDEGMNTTMAPAGPAIHRQDGFHMGIVVALDYGISFYFKDDNGRLCIRETRDLDKALSIGLDFVYG